MHRRRFLVRKGKLAIRVTNFFHASAEYTVIILLPPDWTETLRISEHQLALFYLRNYKYVIIRKERYNSLNSRML